MITKEEARIHAHICGDGYTYISTQRRGESDIKNNFRKNVYRKQYHVRYSNNEHLLKELFKKDIKLAYNRKAFLLSNGEVEVEGKWIFNRLRKFGALDSYNWFVDKNILNGSRAVKVEWTKAFFDDEGTVDMSRKRVRVKSVNFNGLKQVKKMLNGIGFLSKITGKNCDNTWYLTIDRKEDLQKFNRLIGFRHPFRKARLKRIL